MKRFFIVIIIIFFSINCFAQNRNNVWYFGNNAGLDFNTNPPTALTDGNFSQFEASASMCDQSGNLLFYSEGTQVWNRNHTLMPNGVGLKGEASSTQTVLIVPKPCDDSIYYIFTTPCVEFGNDSMYYSILDMRLDGGLGDITVKNIGLRSGIKEKLTACVKSNNIDYWVIAKETVTNVFVSFSVTGNGVNPIPVFSIAGPTMVFADEVGYMRISPDNSKLCAAYWSSNTTYLMDFDNTTGMVSNPIALPVQNDYGAEFSPDNSKLYVCDYVGQQIHQFNLLAGSPTAIQNSDFVFPSGFYHAGALALGPDGRIYMSPVGADYVSVIDQPNQTGAACNFIGQYVSLGLGSCAAGLSNFIKTYSACISCPASTNITSAASICSNQTYQLPSGTIVSTAGTYLDTIRSQAHCDSIINTIHLSVNNLSQANQFDSIFAGQNYTLPSGAVVNAAGTYQSVLPNSFGCDSIITTVLKLKTSIDECLVLKNAFTPNGDGINDLWILYRYPCFKRLEVNVYNRYGSKVYYSNDYKNDWDGKYKNKTLPDATYYYVIKVISYDGKDHVFRDNVTILR